MSNQISISLEKARLAWLENTDLLKRKVVFLDLNFWINLSRPARDVDTQLLACLLNLVDDKKVICPVSPSIVLELSKQPKSAKREACETLMDSLSKGLSLRHSSLTFKDEFRRRLQIQALEREIAYSNVYFSFGDFFLNAPSDTWTPEKLDTVASQLFELTANSPVSTFLRTERFEAIREQQIENLHAGWEQLFQEEEAAKRQKKFTTQEIEEAEFAGAVMSVVDEMTQVIMSLRPEALHRYQGLGREEARRILMDCPSFWCDYHMIAGLRSNRANTRLKVNDAWDLQHVVSAAPYVDCLTCDKATHGICMDSRINLECKYGVRIISGSQGLLDWLKKHAEVEG